MSEVKEVSFSSDVLVIGGGMAGCIAAIHAKEFVDNVILVCKATAGSSGASIIPSGNWMFYDPEKDDLNELVKNCIRVSDFMDDQELAETIIRMSPELVKKTQEWGAKFVMKDGKILRMPMPGFRAPIMFFDGGGSALMWTMRSEVLRRGIKIIDRVMITDLLTSDGKYPTKGSIVGAVGFNVRDGNFYSFKAKTTVLATGSWSIPVQFSHHTADISGDGNAMAFRAGAQMRKMEQTPGASSGIRGCFTASIVICTKEGGTRGLVDRDGRPWENIKAINRGMHSRILAERERTKGIFMDFRDFSPEEIRLSYKSAPHFMSVIECAGYDYSTDLIPRTHSFGGSEEGGGGVRANTKTFETSIPGLFVAGNNTERLYIGITGMLGALVTGWLAGENAAMYAQKTKLYEPKREQINEFKKLVYNPLKYESDGFTPSEIINKIWRVVDEKIGFTKHERRLNEAIEELERIRRDDLPKIKARDFHKLMKANEVRNIIEIAILAAKAGLIRTESRLWHFREEYPNKDDKNWLKWIVAQLKDGELKFWTEDIPTPLLKPEE